MTRIEIQGKTTADGPLGVAHFEAVDEPRWQSVKHFFRVGEVRQNKLPVVVLGWFVVGPGTVCDVEILSPIRNLYNMKVN